MSKKVSVDNRQFYQMSETDKFEFNNGYQELIFDLDNNFQATKAWAESVGLILHDATWQQLKTEGAYFGGQLYNWKALFQQPGGIFRVLNARINNINNNELIALDTPSLFTKLNPPEMFANRAILSTVDPSDAKALREYVVQNKDPSKAIKTFDSHYGQGVSNLVLGQ